MTKRMRWTILMQKNVFKVAGIMSVLIMAICIFSHAENETPVRIAFDKNSERIDIVTGIKLPDYTQAQRGSIQFFQGRLDTPERGFWYFFDGQRFRNIEGLAFIRKIPSIGCWAIARNPSDGTKSKVHPKEQCEIIHHAVSFIPLNESGQPVQRVYVLLDDLDKIQWEEYDHWLATDTQEELNAKQGVIF